MSKNLTLEEVEERIRLRDEQDKVVAQNTTNKIIKSGLSPFVRPDLCSEIDTTGLVGPENNAQKVIELLNSVKSDWKLVCIHGKSGVGKSSTAKELANKSGAKIISLGMIFRYLTLRVLPIFEQDDGLDNRVRILAHVRQNLAHLRLGLVGNEFHLLNLKGKDYSEFYYRELRSHKLEENVPNVAEIAEIEVLKFLRREIDKLKQQGIKMIIEGRPHHTGFLPADWWIELTASSEIRAQRRYLQQGK